MVLAFVYVNMIIKARAHVKLATAFLLMSRLSNIRLIYNINRLADAYPRRIRKKHCVIPGNYICLGSFQNEVFH